MEDITAGPGSFMLTTIMLSMQSYLWTTEGYQHFRWGFNIAYVELLCMI